MWKFLILLLFPLVKPETCSLQTESKTNILWDESEKYELGTFEKTVKAGTSLPGIIIESAKFASIQSGVECSFIDVTQPNNTYVSIKATDGFSNWDSSIAKPKCQFALIFDTSMCENTDVNPARLNFFYTIKDVNLVAPKFNDDSYEMTLAFPISPGTSLNALSGLNIATTDTDFSTAVVTYTIEGGSEDFTLVPLGKSGMDFPVKVETKRLAHLQKPITLTIVAKDDGTNPEQPATKAQLTITPDSKNTVPPTPELTEPLYTAEDIKLEDLKVGYILPIDINLKEDLDDVVLTMDPADIFKATQNGKNIIVEVIKDVEQDGQHTITAVLTATITSGSQTSQSSTAIVISFGEEGNSSSSSTTSTTPSTGGDDTDPTEKCDDPDTGLMAATIIFAITTAILLVITGFGYYKYVHKKPTITPTSHGFSEYPKEPGTIYMFPLPAVISTSYGLPSIPEEPEESNPGKASLEVTNENTQVRKLSRKRSVAFTEDDEASRANRENSVDIETPAQDETPADDETPAQDETPSQDETPTQETL